MYYQLQMQAENNPQEQHFSCYIYHIPKERNAGIRKHCHSYSEIIYSIEENSYVSYNGNTLCLRPGELLFIPPLVPHETIPAGDFGESGSSFILQFSNRFLYGREIPAYGMHQLTHHPRFGNISERFPVNTCEHYTLQHIMEEILTICRKFPDPSLPPEQFGEIMGLCSEDEPIGDLQITPYFWKARSLSLLLLAELMEKNYLAFGNSLEISAQELDQLKPLITEMIESPEKSMTMEQAAQMVNMSYHHFCRTFKKMFGSSFVEYKNFLRVQYAEQLLLETNKSITEIAEDINFGSLSYFNRMFKQINGISPSEYRSKKQNKRKDEQK